jgi:hypothetical protein
MEARSIAQVADCLRDIFEPPQASRQFRAARIFFEAQRNPSAEFGIADTCLDAHLFFVATHGHIASTC